MEYKQLVMLTVSLLSYSELCDLWTWLHVSSCLVLTLKEPSYTWGSTTPVSELYLYFIRSLCWNIFVCWFKMHLLEHCKTTAKCDTINIPRTVHDGYGKVKLSLSVLILWYELLFKSNKPIHIHSIIFIYLYWHNLKPSNATLGWYYYR